MVTHLFAERTFSVEILERNHGFGLDVSYLYKFCFRIVSDC